MTLHSVPLFKLNKWQFHILTTPTSYDYTPTLSNEGNVPIIALDLSTGLVTMATQSHELQTKTNSEQKTLNTKLSLQIYNFKKYIKYWFLPSYNTDYRIFS